VPGLSPPDGLPRHRTGDDTLDQAVLALLAAAGIDEHRHFYFEMLASVLRMGREGVDRGDVKIVTTTLRELRHAFHVFAPYRRSPKAALFGSARTPPEEPAYSAAVDLGAALARAGWMVITGGGPGIMTAGVEGAGADASFGVSITLPFEPASSRPLIAEDRAVNFRYFFNRKLTFMKESAGFVLFPGGFGTLDEAFELLTLLQTGRANPAPVVLFEPPGDAYWRSFRHFLEVELLDPALVSPEDLELFSITHDVDSTVSALTAFYRTFHSMRHVGGYLVVRLQHEISDAALAVLDEQFRDIVASGRIERSPAMRAELDDDDVSDLPRLRFRFVNARYARLHAFVRALNALDALLPGQAPRRAPS
jgi:uncharacterized protein (TIGR00730 family)